MQTLRDFQNSFRSFLSGDEIPGLSEWFVGDPEQLAQRLAIYRNNFVVSHTIALSHVFPVTQTLVDPRFFAFAAHTYLQQNPPASPCMSDFGGDFPAFLAAFPPAASVSYLCDLARLEWAISRASIAAPVAAVSAQDLISIGEDAAGLKLLVRPGVSFIASDYPIDVIWDVHRSESLPDTFTAEPESVFLEVGSHGPLSVRRRKAGEWAFRTCIAHGYKLGAAVEMALERDETFDVESAFCELFEQGMIVGVRN